MKLFADMHVHSKFSIDGTSTMEEYCLTAEKTGSRIICFTEHVDFNSMEKNLSIIKDNRTQNFVVDDYFCEINRFFSFFTFINASSVSTYLSMMIPPSIIILFHFLSNKPSIFRLPNSLYTPQYPQSLHVKFCRFC